MNGRTSKGRLRSRSAAGERAFLSALSVVSLAAAALCPRSAAAQPTPAEESKETRVVEFRADPLVISPVVLMQVQAIPYIGDDAFIQAGDMAEQPGFRLRRALIGFTGELYDVVPFEISAELTGNIVGSSLDGGVRINDAWIGYRHREWLEIYAGAHTLPYTRSAMASASNTALIDRPLAVRAMAPFQQVGVHVEGSLFRGALSYNVGIWNGLQRSDQFFAGFRQNAAASGNRFDELAYSARVSTEPFGPLGSDIADFDHTPRLRLGTGVSYFFSDGGTRDIHGGNADVLIHWKGLHFLGEFLLSQADPEDVPSQPTTQIARVKSLAAVGEVGYAILKSRLGVSARVEWINPSTDITSEADSLVITGGASYFVVEDVLKAQAEYTHREELGGKALKNDVVAIQLQLKL